MSKNDIILSLNSETFSALKKDFDTVLGRLLGNMQMKGAEDASITLKLNVSLSKVGVGTTDFTKPTFKHEISSVMQIKDKMTGQLTGDYAMVWDEDEKRFILRHIDNGQVSMFNDEPDGRFVDADYETIEDVEPLALPAPDTTEPVDTTMAFEFLLEMAGNKFEVTQELDQYVVRNEEGALVIGSHLPERDPLYSDAKVLAAHNGHTLTCDDVFIDGMHKVTLKCDFCEEVVFSIESAESYSEAEPEADTDEEISEEIAEEIAYEAPEE